MTKGLVWLLDASAIIRIKTQVPGNQQWRLFRQLEEMVVSGDIAFPKQIRVEVAGMAHPDAPGVWVDGVFPLLQHPAEPESGWIRHVMASKAAAVVDPNKAREDGDPFLLALALQLKDDGHEVCIVTEDQADNPSRIALSVACEHLSLGWCGLAEFLSEIQV